MLATAIEHDTTGTARAALRRATRAAGRTLGRELTGAEVDGVLQALDERGYAPVIREDGIRLRNCPFHHLVGEHLDLVCTLDRDLLGTAVTSAKVGLRAELDPQPGECCVVLRRRS